MNMKKILASVAASAIAVTSLATVASAVDLVGKEGTKYTATITYRIDGNVSADAETGEITPAAPVKGAADIDSFSIKAVVQTSKSTADKTKKNGDNLAVPKFSYTKSTNDTTGEKDFVDVPTGADYSLFYEIKVTSGTEIKNNTEPKDVITIPADAKNALLSGATFEKTPAGVLASGMVIVAGKDVPEGKVGVRMSTADYDVINANGATISITFSGDKDANDAKVSANATVEGVTDPYTANSSLVSEGKKVTLTISIPKGVVASKDMDGNVSYKTITVNYAKDAKVSVTAASIVANGATTPTETTTTEAKPDVKPDETTTPAPTDPAATTTPAPKPTTPDEDKNAPTGVGLVVVPALVAAAGVIISKKRK